MIQIEKRTLVRVGLLCAILIAIYFAAKAIQKNKPQAKVKPMYEDVPEAVPMDIDVNEVVNTNFLNLSTDSK